MAKPQNAVYAPGEDQASRDANLAYQDALNKLTESLDKRKNRLFDPTWLAISQGFLKPGTSNFFESLGNVAENIGRVQEGLIKEDQDIAQQRLDVAGRGVELQRQKAKDAMVRRFLSGEEEPPPSTGALPATSRSQTGEPSGALPAQGALAQAAAQDATASDMGFQLFPGIPGISRRQFFSLGLADGKNISDIAKEWEAIQRGRLQSKENYTVDTVTGRGFLLPNADTVQVQIFNRDGSTRTYPVTKSQAIRLSELAEKNDAEGYFALADRITRGPGTRPPAAQSPVAQGPAAQGPAAQQPPPLLSSPALSAPPALAAPVAPAAVPSAPATSLQSPPSSQEPAGGVQQRIIQSAREHLANVGAAPAQVAPVAAQPVPQAAAPAARPPAALPAAPQVAQAAPAAVQSAAPVAASPVAARAVTSGLRSLEEIAAEKRQSEIQQAADTKRAEELAKAAAAKEAAVEQNDRTARNTYQSSSRILDYLKKSPNFFGIFARPGVVPAIGGFIEQGLRTANGTIDLPGFRDSITKLMPNVRQQDLDNLMLAASELAEIELNFSRQYFQGQGPVTESERKIVRAIPGSVSSSPRVLKARMELLRDRAQYDIDVADAFRDWQGKNVGRSYLDFERDSQLYKDIKSDFEKKAAKIYNGLPAIPTRERRAADQQGAVQQQSSQSSGVQPSVGFIRDPNTGVIRRKKPGE